MYKVKSRIKENGKVYNAGDEYTGANADSLVQSGALELVKVEKKAKAAKKPTRKKKTKKE